MHAEDASNTISESDYGTHTLVVYEDLEKLREFYSYYVKKRVEERNEVIQLAPFYETEDSVRKSLSEGNISIDIEKWEKDEKSLIIVDSLKKYFDSDSLESDYDSNKKLVDYAKAIGKSGVSVLGDTGVFPYKHRIEELVNYELSLPSKYDIDLKRLCLFHKKDFNRLSEEQKQKLLNHHPVAIKI
jgi:hypothetical protein